MIAALPTSVRLVLLLFLCAAMTSCGSTRKLRQQADAIVARVELPAQKVELRDLQRECHRLAQHRLPYVFGGESLGEGGMDCSGTIHHVLTRVGFRYVPRQSNHQYHWLAKAGTLKKASRLDERTLRKMRPGDLMFWKGTYRTGKRWPNVSHVMIYMGRDPNTGKHWMFGGRGQSASGRNGGGVDFFSFSPREGGRRNSKFIGFGRVPGVKR
ncbi:NlpC/P60 family protein [Sulfuriroseicoccus oceanibius]|uniref:C40 family peptidase n=1 Tax=Sulfuriroseicoccus oceanibius TaxID=2707525 RepID=A0A6B3L013_9BACT|nr:NlpC/P60 family protein [Sulfuriroseicoccus oceanibius]QQL43678.1 C40 family peptidase [Sulfuriroseicoccus oceanibius]